MSIPLIQDNQKDSINASLIAIKREEERLQALIAEADKKIAQLNELKVSKSDIVDEVTLNNMQSVTSNAVAEALYNVETWNNSGVSLYKIGKIVYGYYSGQLSGSGSKTITTVPSSFKPIEERRNALINNVTDNFAGQFIIRATNGQVQAYPAANGSFTSGIQYLCSFMYMTN